MWTRITLAGMTMALALASVAIAHSDGAASTSHPAARATSNVADQR